MIAVFFVHIPLTIDYLFWFRIFRLTTYQKDQERIFQAFEKVDSFTPNAGLGLTFACQYAATLGGSVTLVRSQPGVGSVFKLSLSQPIIASNHQAFKLQSNLPKSWSYWMQQNRDKHELYSPYCAALRRLGLTPADSPSEASLLVQVMTRFGSVIAEEALSPLSNQVLLTLGWEDEHHSKSSGNLDHSRIAYGRLPWTRNRLVSTLLQAQKLARRNGEDGRPFTPVKELGSLDLSDPEQRSEVSRKTLRPLVEPQMLTISGSRRFGLC